jgi:hypothetical protein
MAAASRLDQAHAAREEAGEEAAIASISIGLVAEVSFVRRFKVLIIGLVLGVFFSLWVAGPMMPSGLPIGQRAWVWLYVMGGPIIGTAWGISDFHLPINLGWLGLMLIPAHPLRPNFGTSCLTLFGLSLWYFAGFLAIMVAVWGA